MASVIEPAKDLDDDERDPPGEPDVPGLNLPSIPKVISIILKAIPIILIGIFGISAGLLWQRSHTEVDEYVPKSWNAAIERLGITPLYPPQEDVFVGDVFLAINPSKQKFRDFPDDIQRDSMIGRSVKVGHLDFTEFMRRPPDARYFGDNARNTDGSLALLQPRRETDKDSLDAGKVVLSDLLFPAITLERDGTFSGVERYLGLSASAASTEKIVLSHVQSYSADAYLSSTSLRAFCADKTTRGFCIEKSARTQLAYMIDDDILRTAKTDDGDTAYLFDIRIFVIYKIYLARGLQVGSGVGTTAQLFSTNGEKKPQASSIKVEALPLANSSPTSSGTPPTPGSEDKPVSTEDNQAFQISRTDKRTFWSDEPFTRPLVFGYRSISMGMRPK